jgi:hypothetical protein
MLSSKEFNEGAGSCVASSASVSPLLPGPSVNLAELLANMETSVSAAVAALFSSSPISVSSKLTASGATDAALHDDLDRGHA